jgi:capsular exopolysaccharide synthesis family protein
VERSPGLSEVILSTALVSDAMCASSIPGLWVLPAGDRPSNAAELLASKRFESFLKAAGQRFEWVVIDSPPVLAVTDPCVIAPLVSGVLFVVGSEMTTKHSVQTALEELEAVNAKFVGTVLNRVQVYRHAYYYSDYYKAEYGQYYERMA